jgi:hypothetical protein
MIAESVREGDVVTITFDGDHSRVEAAQHARRYTTTILATRDGVRRVRQHRLRFLGSAEAQQTTPIRAVYRYALVPIAH